MSHPSLPCLPSLPGPGVGAREESSWSPTGFGQVCVPLGRSSRSRCGSDIQGPGPRGRPTRSNRTAVTLGTVSHCCPGRKRGSGPKKPGWRPAWTFHCLCKHPHPRGLGCIHASHVCESLVRGLPSVLSVTSHRVPTL